MSAQGYIPDSLNTTSCTSNDNKFTQAAKPDYRPVAMQRRARPGEPHGLSFGVVAALPDRFRYCFLRLAAKMCGWTGPLPTLNLLAGGLTPAPSHQDVTFAQALHRALDDDRWRLPNGDFDSLAVARAHRHYMADREAKRDLYRRYRGFANAALELLRQITPPEGEITAEGISLMDGDAEAIDRRAEELACSWGAMPVDPRPIDRKRRSKEWWIRQLRREGADARQFFSAALKMVGGEYAYIDAHSLDLWRSRQERARIWAAVRQLVNAETGKTIPMAEVIEKGKQAAIASVYSMMRAVGDRARAEGKVPVFVTLTLPGIWHPNPKQGRRTWTPAHHPKAADRMLQTMWAQLRSRWKKAGVETVGFWSREPHEDGCPHQHGVFWVDADQMDGFTAAIRFAWPDEAAAEIVEIDEGRAAAESYAMFYILKSFNAAPEDDLDRRPARDRHGEDGLGHHDEVRAWASERRLRRFAFVGVHGSRKVWQKIRTWREPPEGASATMHAAWAAFQAGDYVTALNLIEGQGKITGIRLAYEERETRYGEVVRRPWALHDIEMDVVCPLSNGAWTVEVKEVEGDVVTVVATCPR